MQSMNVPYSTSEDATEVSSTSDGGGSSFGGSAGFLPHRQYNTHMAKRMRQRRMRRMKERDTAAASITTSANRAKGSNERYKQKRSSSSSVPANPTAGELDPISSIPNPSPPPTIIKKQIPTSIFALSSPPETKNIPNTIVAKKKNSSQVVNNTFPRLSESCEDKAGGDENHISSIKHSCNSHSSADVEVFDENNFAKTNGVNGEARRGSPKGVSSPNAPGSTHADNAGHLRIGGLLDTLPYQQDEIDEDVRQSIVFQALRKQMLKPSPQLDELLKQIHRDCSTRIDRTFATRRKNACGALKVLVAEEENRLKIAWTSGVISAIASVLQDVQVVIQDEQNRLANIEARNRIVSVLLDLSLNKKNRLLIVSTPGLLESIAEAIAHDTGEGRQGCCTVLFYLSKTVETKSAIAKNEGLMDAISKVIEVPTWIAPQQPEIPDVCKNVDTNTMDTRSTHDDMSFTSSSERSRSSLDHDDCDDMEDSGGVERVKEKERRFTFSLSYETVVDSSPPVEIDYDLDPNQCLHGARLMAFASLLCLVKSKDTVTFIARQDVVIETLLKVSLQFSSPSHVRALAILAHLTRHPQNCHLLVFENSSFIPLLQEVISHSPDAEGRRYALCALQNLSVDTSCRAAVAHTPNMIKCLLNRLKRSSKGETVAAIATLQNLADEPANLILFTTVKNCVASILELARRCDDYGAKETELASFLAKNTLATLSHFFRRIATSGSERITSESGNLAPHILQNAVLRPRTYQGWS